MPRRALDPAGSCVACAESDMTCPQDHPLEVLLQELLASGCSTLPAASPQAIHVSCGVTGRHMITGHFAPVEN